MKKTFLVLFLFLFIPACATVPEQTPTPLATDTLSPTITASPTATVTASPTPKPELTAEDFGLPVTFEGDYALGHKLAYAPCYHWDPTTFDPSEVTSDNWYEYFHAGDLHMLNLSRNPEEITILSPIKGKISDIVDYGDNGLLLTITTPFYYMGKKVKCDIAHMNEIFKGDELNPKISLGIEVNKGQPIGISNKHFNWGRLEQSVDIGIYTGPMGGAYPLYSDFSPESFLDPFIFLEDDIEQYSEHIVFDTMRSHCLKSGHFE